jgi:PIN domain nuclease of toxin-antitoxin system
VELVNNLDHEDRKRELEVEAALAALGIRPRRGFMSTTSKRVGWAVLPIDPAIAALAQSERFAHGDPADRSIGTTALRRNAQLISADSRLQNLKGLKVIW